eukprot:TRINITY_DN2456_c0_g1_i2.p2 TRINITY_DN2456_c0_g1~~TRINITY_DN2456_c0_g1_i2.p2  ORF type:complete len:318 (-),score=97.62 TRINITY_DN2456_c0_g1_i2:7-960(-)
MEVASPPDDGVDWFCKNNTDAEHNHCHDPEENMDLALTQKPSKRKRRTQDEIVEDELTKLQKKERILKKKRRVLKNRTKSYTEDDDDDDDDDEDEDEEEEEETGGDELVGKMVKIYWKDEGKWFKGRIIKYRETHDDYQIEYEDGDVMYEPKNEFFKVVEESTHPSRPKLFGGERAPASNEERDKVNQLARTCNVKLKYVLDSLSIFLPVHLTPLLEFKNISEFDEKQFCQAVIDYHKSMQDTKRRNEMQIDSLQESISQAQHKAEALSSLSNPTDPGQAQAQTLGLALSTPGPAPTILNTAHPSLYPPVPNYINFV